MLTTAGVEIDLVDSDEALALPDVTNDPEEEDDGQSEIGFEEALSVVQIAGERRSNGHEELRCQCNEDEEETDPRAGDAEESFEGNIIERTSLVFPCLSEADVCLFTMSVLLS